MEYLQLYGIDIGIQMVGWIISSVFHTEKHFDLFGSLTYILLILRSYNKNKPTALTRQSLSTGMVMIWALRLGCFLFYRVLASGEDKRFENVRSDPSAFLVYWFVQSLWVFFTLFPALVVNIEQNQQRQLSITDYLGVALWVAGFMIEVIADYQKTQFRSDLLNKNNFISTGLWSISRHPNYFGEVVLWIGVTLLATSAFSGWKWIGLLSPGFVYLLLNFVSGIPILEASGLKKFGHLPAYQEYLHSVPVFLPIWGSR